MSVPVLKRGATLHTVPSRREVGQQPVQRAVKPATPEPPIKCRDKKKDYAAADPVRLKRLCEKAQEEAAQLAGLLKDCQAKLDEERQRRAAAECRLRDVDTAARAAADAAAAEQERRRHEIEALRREHDALQQRRADELADWTRQDEQKEARLQQLDAHVEQLQRRQAQLLVALERHAIDPVTLLAPGENERDAAQRRLAEPDFKARFADMQAQLASRHAALQHSLARMDHVGDTLRQLTATTL